MFSREMATTISSVSAEIEEGLSTVGYCIIDDAFSQSLLSKLRDEVVLMYEMGELDSSPSKLTGHQGDEFCLIKPNIYERALVQRGEVVAKRGFLSTFGMFKQLCDEKEQLLMALHKCGPIGASLTKLDQLKCE